MQPNVGAAGPQPAYYFYADGAFGSLENVKDWVVEITGNGDVNPSTQGMGVTNNIFQTGETLHFEFDDEGASTVGDGIPNLAYRAEIGLSDFAAFEFLQYVANYTDGSQSSRTLVPADLNAAGMFVVDAPVGVYLDSIDLAPGASTSIRIVSLVAYF